MSPSFCRALPNLPVMDLSLRREGYLTGHLLVAMPGMSDTRFARSVIFLCAHSEEGAMGIVINRELESITFDDLMEQLDIETAGEDVDLPVQSGGPVETGRGLDRKSGVEGKRGSDRVILGGRR